MSRRRNVSNCVVADINMPRSSSAASPVTSYFFPVAASTSSKRAMIWRGCYLSWPEGTEGVPPVDAQIEEGPSRLRNGSLRGDEILGLASNQIVTPDQGRACAVAGGGVRRGATKIFNDKLRRRDQGKPECWCFLWMRALKQRQSFSRWQIRWGFSPRETPRIDQRSRADLAYGT